MLFGEQSAPLLLSLVPMLLPWWQSIRQQQQQPAKHPQLHTVLLMVQAVCLGRRLMTPCWAHIPHHCEPVSTAAMNHDMVPQQHPVWLSVTTGPGGGEPAGPRPQGVACHAITPLRPHPLSGALAALRSQYWVNAVQPKGRSWYARLHKCRCAYGLVGC